MVAGRNGSGKSTLLRVLATALRPDRGTATIEDIPLIDRDAVRHRVALLGHQSHMYEPLTALQNLQTAAHLLGRDASRAALMPLLQQVGLAARSDDAVRTFSAGMRKRLSIARMLLQRASVVFLDEPYGQLDPPGFRLIDDLVARLRSEGTSIVMATHMLERSAALCDVGLVLNAGRLQWMGKASDLPSAGGLGEGQGE